MYVCVCVYNFHFIFPSVCPPVLLASVSFSSFYNTHATDACLNFAAAAAASPVAAVLTGRTDAHAVP